LDIERIASGLRRILMAAGGVALIALVLLATGNVALRVVRAPLGGAYEIVAFLGAIVGFFGPLGLVLATAAAAFYVLSSRL